MIYKLWYRVKCKLGFHDWERNYLDGKIECFFCGREDENI